jgi:hypothetical protein
MLDHKQIQNDLEMRLGKLGYYHASCTEFNVQGIHGEMDDYGVKLRERRIIVIEVKGKDTDKNRETVYNQLRKDSLLINRLFFDSSYRYCLFLCSLIKRNEKGYDVERIYL